PDTFRRFRPRRKEKEDQKQKRHSGWLPGWTSPLPRFDLTDLNHAWRGSTVPTKVDTYRKSRFANRHRETVEGAEIQSRFGFGFGLCGCRVQPCRTPSAALAGHGPALPVMKKPPFGGFFIISA
ncbi:hypothetical protein, partial [Stenotrophomonas maltophilia]